MTNETTSAGLRLGWVPVDYDGERYYFSRYEVVRVKMPTSIYARRPRQSTPVGYVVCDHTTGTAMTKPMKRRRDAQAVCRYFENWLV
jgi:hypothetical protein